MAPRPEDIPGQPDGQGSVAPEKVSRYSYDADEKAKERESADVTIGGVVYHRRRKNWTVTRGLRTLLRVQERAGMKGNRLATQLEKLPAEAGDAEIDRIEGEMDSYQDQSDEAVYKIIALLLRDGEGNEPGLDALKEELDIEDAGAMAQSLSGGGQPAEGPTQTETS